MDLDKRHLKLPDEIANDASAFELLSAWAQGKRIMAMTVTGTRLDANPEQWGQVLAAIANNIALSAVRTTNADHGDVLAKIKAGLDRKWTELGKQPGELHSF